MRNFRMSFLGVAAVSAAGLLAGCGGSAATKPPAPAGLASLPAKKIISETDAAVTAAGWVSPGLTAKAGSDTITSSGVIGPSVGRETIKLTGGGRATVMVIAGVGYARGSAAVLHGFLNLPARDTRPRLAHKWIVFHQGDPGYQQVVPGLTLSSFLAQVVPNGSLTKTGRTTIAGQAVIGVRADAPASANMPAGTTDTLYVAATGKPLPVECVEAIETDKIILTFTRWGQPEKVTRPLHTVPAPGGSGSA
jgi:hypothetical protein